MPFRSRSNCVLDANIPFEDRVFLTLLRRIEVETPNTVTKVRARKAFKAALAIAEDLKV